MWMRLVKLRDRFKKVVYGSNNRILNKMVGVSSLREMRYYREKRREVLKRQKTEEF